MTRPGRDDPKANRALKRKSDSDYILREGHSSVWVTVDNISVYVRRTDEGVAVDLYPVGEEMEDSLCGTWALFSEAEPDCCLGCGRPEDECSKHPCAAVVKDRKL